MDEVAATSMAFCKRHVSFTGVDTVEAAESFIIGAQHDFIRSWKFNSDAVVGEWAIGIEVEDEYVTIPLEADNFVAFVTPRHVSWVAVQPAILLLSQIHCAIELVEKFILQGVVV